MTGRPRAIVQAIALLWVSTGLGVASSFSETPRPSQGDMVASVLLMVAILGVLTVALWRGRNWGRMLYLVLVAMSLASLISSWGTAERPGIAVALEAVSFVADAGSFFLMFTVPGSLWFQSQPEQRDRA